jgi:hypothetical protein
MVSSGHNAELPTCSRLENERYKVSAQQKGWYNGKTETIYFTIYPASWKPLHWLMANHRTSPKFLKSASSLFPLIQVFRF